MKVAILAGGLGTRLTEETTIHPKPMVEIGNKPILWHIMKIYSHYGFNDFVILGGYKQNHIKNFFVNYYTDHCDLTVDFSTNSIEFHDNQIDPWKVTILDTGTETLTGGRIKKAQKYLENDTFMLTYGDGVADINIKELVDFHKKQQRLATMSIVPLVGKFGAVKIDDKTHQVVDFHEKPKYNSSLINIGFFVLEPKIFHYLNDSEQEIWETTPLQKLTQDGQLSAYTHQGFWRPMDMLRDKIELNAMWEQGAPWKIWS